VHNFKECMSMQEAQEFWKLQVLQPFKLKEKKHQLYPIFIAENTEYHCIHVYLINDKVTHQHNQHVITYLKSQLQTFSSVKIDKLLEQSFSKHLEFYLKFEDPKHDPPQVIIDWDNQMIVNNTLDKLSLRDYGWDHKTGTVYFKNNIYGYSEDTPSSHLIELDNIFIEVETPGVGDVDYELENDEILVVNGIVNTQLSSLKDNSIKHIRRSLTKSLKFHLPKGYETNTEKWKVTKNIGVVEFKIPKKELPQKKKKV